jgi:hypothetical protein
MFSDAMSDPEVEIPRVLSMDIKAKLPGERLCIDLPHQNRSDARSYSLGSEFRKSRQQDQSAGR